MNGTDVVIVGGGVAGAAAACAFAIAGSRVVVFERRDLVRDPNRADNRGMPCTARQGQEEPWHPASAARPTRIRLQATRNRLPSGPPGGPEAHPEGGPAPSIWEMSG